mmetsp:Transcript_6265/g.14780  ORF Transcript_6265/g.14780 Transcript_6265/m.14780 type:complete len:92 (-) Transcript_6265:1554-1829(-)
MQPLCMMCKFDSCMGLDEITEQEMRAFLRDIKVACPATASYESVLKMYHTYKSDDDKQFSVAIDEVQYPLLPASALHTSRLFAYSTLYQRL